MAGLFSPTRYGMETIDFQLKDTIGRDIERFFEIIDKELKDRHYEFDKDRSNKILIDLLFKRFGIKVRLHTESALAAVMPFYSNRHHIFLDDIWRGVNIREQTAFLRKLEKRKGTVDLKHAKLGGFFSEYVHDLYLNMSALVDYKLTPAERTGITLHENGHIFYACEYANRMDTTNQVLGNIALELAPEKKNKDLKYIYTEIKKVNPEITEEEVDRMVNSSDLIAGYTWFKTVVGAVGTQMKIAKYDETAFEQGADNFASRFGYGRHLVTGLDKLYLASGSPEKFESVRKLNRVFEVLGLVGGLGLVVGWIGAGLVAQAVLLAMLMMICFVTSGESFMDYTYDELKLRYTRIRQDSIACLKDMKLPPDQVKAVLDSIALMDKIIDETAVYRGLFNRVANLVLPWERRTSAAIQEQQLLEEMANNDLFVAGAKFGLVAN